LAAFDSWPLGNWFGLSLTDSLRPIRREVGRRYRKWSLERRIPSFPRESVVPLGRTTDVLLLCSRLARDAAPEAHIPEVAFARSLVERGRTFAVSDDPSALFDKSVMWFLPARLIAPRLWDHSRQVYEFTAALEQQGNHLFCSSDEVLYWENKAYMHRKLAEIGVATPETRVLTSTTWTDVEFDIEPVLIKEEHSAGSSGVHYFARSAEAREFVKRYSFRPTESLLMQEVVRGATRDLRLTMVGDRMIRSASFWRIKTSDTSSNGNWTTTATTYGSVVKHGDVPESVVPLAADHLRSLGIRTAGIDLMWVDDDLASGPLILELSPYYQPNPRRVHARTPARSALVVSSQALGRRRRRRSRRSCRWRPA
jgi:glutathione synthase/RimK-type ligase-like ATP-grasp enzyme